MHWFLAIVNGKSEVSGTWISHCQFAACNKKLPAWIEHVGIVDSQVVLLKESILTMNKVISLLK